MTFPSARRRGVARCASNATRGGWRRGLGHVSTGADFNVGWDFFQSSLYFHADPLDNAIEICEHIQIPEAKNSIALANQPMRAIFVVGPSVVLHRYDFARRPR